MSYVYPKRYDVIVVGAGHAGIEAALAAARMGCQTLLLTANCDTIGQMSCNPAIGGLGKGQLVREVDALGGEMGKTTDMTGIQFRMLNTKKGPSVRSPRAQCDKKAYQFRMKWICERQPNLDVSQAQTTALLHKTDRVFGVSTILGVDYHGTCIIVTTGTFLQGLIHIGDSRHSGGRSGEPSALTLSNSLRSLGLELGRLKTGTPPRILKRSVNFSKLEPQFGDDDIPYFSSWKEDLTQEWQVRLLGLTSTDKDEFFSGRSHEVFHVEQSSGRYPPGSMLSIINGQMPCYISYTTAETAEIIRANLHKSAVYSGRIEGIGPRYCPSIEDKVVRFHGKDRHQVFIEPEGAFTDEIYLNGLSTCLPIDIQFEMLRTISGCKDAQILRPAYAVEYDFVFPTQLNTNLETKICQNLFLAGQINGTSGYEEAAAQGLIAGINAARCAQSKAPVSISREQGYIGVLIDDLVTKGTAEPYRMFTSRAEHRLTLRQDNADLRLSGLGYDIGLLPERNYLRVEAKREAVLAEILRLQTTREGAFTLAQLLRRPESTYRNLPQTKSDIPESVATQVEIAIKYEGYIANQEAEISKSRQMEHRDIPEWIDYESISSLRTEARQKLGALRPKTIGQASRISGVTPADIGVLLVWMKRKEPSVPADSADTTN